MILGCPLCRGVSMHSGMFSTHTMFHLFLSIYKKHYFPMGNLPLSSHNIPTELRMQVEFTFFKPIPVWGHRIRCLSHKTSTTCFGGLSLAIFKLLQNNRKCI